MPGGLCDLGKVFSANSLRGKNKRIREEELIVFCNFLQVINHSLFSFLK